MIQSSNKMKLIKPSVIALAIVGLAALVAIGGMSEDPSPACESGDCAQPHCEAPNEPGSGDMPPDLCDEKKRCSCESNVLPGNQLYCVKRNAPFHMDVSTYSLACIDYWRYCIRGEMRLCYKGPCAPDALQNHSKCINSIDTIGRSP